MLHLRYFFLCSEWLDIGPFLIFKSVEFAINQGFASKERDASGTVVGWSPSLFFLFAEAHRLIWLDLLSGSRVVRGGFISTMQSGRPKAPSFSIFTDTQWQRSDLPLAAFMDARRP